MSSDINRMIEVMTAYKNGAKIQRLKDGNIEWEDVLHPAWNWPEFDYRVKPVPREFYVSIHKGNGSLFISTELTNRDFWEVIKVKEII